MRDEFAALADQENSQYFYSNYVDEIGERHVAWIDIMGILDHLRQDQQYPAVVRGELLSVVSEHVDEDQVRVTTVGDGVILITEDKDYLLDFLDALLLHYARFNVTNWRNDEDIWLSRLLRVGVGTGEIQEIDVENYVSAKRNGNIFHDNFRNEPFGPGMIRAMQSEKGSPYSIHEYMGRGNTEPVRWWENFNLDEESRIDIVRMLKEYFDWYDSSGRYRYSPYAANHYQSALDYFDVSEADVEQTD